MIVVSTYLLILGFVTTPAEVGLYESAMKIIAILTMIVTALGTVMLPRMSNLIANDNGEHEALLSKSFIFAIFISSAMAFGIMGISKLFVPLFYGPGFMGAAVNICINLVLIPIWGSIGASIGTFFYRDNSSSLSADDGAQVYTSDEIY